jgi:hypothetical protein
MASHIGRLGAPGGPPLPPGLWVGSRSIAANGGTLVTGAVPAIIW